MRLTEAQKALGRDAFRTPLTPREELIFDNLARFLTPEGAAKTRESIERIPQTPNKVPKANRPSKRR